MAALAAPSIRKARRASTRKINGRSRGRRADDGKPKTGARRETQEERDGAGKNGEEKNKMLHVDSLSKDGPNDEREENDPGGEAEKKKARGLYFSHMVLFVVCG